ITSITVNLSTNSGVGTLTITNGADTVLGSIGGGIGTGIVTGSNAISITSTDATTGGTAFKVKVTPLSHANMPVPDGGAYAITGAVTDWAGNNTKAGQASDTSDTVTIDNDSPAGTTVLTPTAGDAQVQLDWTNPGDGDFQQVYIYCKTATMISGEAPTEGTDPTVDETACNGTARMKSKGAASPQTITGLTNGTLYYFRVYARDTNGNFTAFTAAQEVSATPVASTVITVDEIGTQTSPLFIPSTGNYIGGAFTMIRGTGTANVTSITITESGTVDALNNLNNIKLQYDLDTVTPYDCNSVGYNAGDTQYGATDTNGFSAANGTSVFTGTVAVSDVQAMCVYVALDVLSGASDGQTIIVRITNPSTDVLVSAGTVSPITAQGAGTTTLEVPKITVGTEGTQANMVIGTGDNNVGGAFTFVRNTGTANVTQIIITDLDGSVNANLYISDVVLFYKQEATCSASIPGDATQYNSTGVGFNASEKATVVGDSGMAVGTSQICVYVRLDVGSGASNGDTLEIEISNPSTEVTVSAGFVGPAFAVAISGTTTLQGATYTSYGMPFLFTSANWGIGSVSFYYEVYMRATTGTVYARLYNETDSTAVSGSVLSTTSTSFVRLRTATLTSTLIDGKTYRAQFGKVGADTGETLGGKLVVNQNAGGGGEGGADIAETYFSEEIDSLEAGYVVSLNQTKQLFIQKSTTPYDKNLIGVISTLPQIVLGEKTNQTVPVALVGRVPVKVNLEEGSIQTGDLLTSSSSPGVAMKATQAGRVIGMALESFDGAQGEIGQILVFINPHWQAGQLSADGSLATGGYTIDISSPSALDISSLASLVGDINSFIKQALASLGLFIENGIAQVKELVAERIFAKRVQVNELEMIDKATSEIYCTWIENGEWMKEKGECVDPVIQETDSASTTETNSVSDESSEIITTEESTEATETPPMTETPSIQETDSTTTTEEINSVPSESSETIATTEESTETIIETTNQ
ncbi:MAG: hypothetical protein Q8N56_01645, partial [bacterium]|nr:hypothetical protein [bacterium]